MISYENRRDQLWKDAYKNAIEFEHGDSPKANVVSFFCKRKENDPEINLKGGLQSENPYDSITFDRLNDVSFLEERLNHVLRYTKKWNNYNTYLCIALQEYLKQCKDGGFSKCILSVQELALLLPKKSK